MIKEELLPALIGFFGAIIGAIFSALANLYLSFRRDKDLRKQPFLAKQLELCLEASGVVAKLATTASREDFDIAYGRFLELFWGPLSVVENKALSLLMVKYRKKLLKLIKSGAPLPYKTLQNDSYALALEVRKLILSAWEIQGLTQVLDVQKDSNADLD